MNFLTLNEYTHDDLMDIFKRIDAKDFSTLNGKSFAMLFFENSTRTHYSFIKAAHDLGGEIVDFNTIGSSLSKGESFFDTIKTFESLGVNGLVIRNPQKEYWNQLKTINIPIINGGDGSGSHPSQALLDLYTIYKNFNKIKELKILIVGDIKHSRVAKSNIKLLRKMGSHVDITGPSLFKINDPYWINDFDKNLHQYDVVMLLRIQDERFDGEYDKNNYNDKYGLNANRLERMKENSVILHPGPFNVGVEITNEVLKDKRCKIWNQVKNGVEVRKMIYTLIDEAVSANVL